MRTLIILSALFMASLQAAQINATWTYDFTGAAICSATVTANCLDHFEVGIIPTNGGFDTIASVPLPATPTGVVQGIAWTGAVNNAFGSQTFSVVMVGKDGAGARITSAPTAASLALVLSPSSPTKFAGTVQ